MLGVFKKKKVFNKSTHEIKLQMYTYLINSLFKNKKLEESLAYKETNIAMNEFDGYLRDKFLFYYYNSLVNYSMLDKEKQ